MYVKSTCYKISEVNINSFRDEVTGGGANYLMRNLMICTPKPILFGDKIEKNEKVWACCAYGDR